MKCAEVIHQSPYLRRNILSHFNYIIRLLRNGKYRDSVLLVRYNGQWDNLLLILSKRLLICWLHTGRKVCGLFSAHVCQSWKIINRSHLSCIWPLLASCSFCGHHSSDDSAPPGYDAMHPGGYRILGPDHCLLKVQEERKVPSVLISWG